MSRFNRSPPATPVPSPVLGPSPSPSFMPQEGSRPVSHPSSLNSEEQLALVGCLLCVSAGYLYALYTPNVEREYLIASVVVAITIVCSFCIIAPLYKSYKKTGRMKNGSILCIVEVEVDNETIVTVRSWWSDKLTKEVVRTNGERVALQNAQQWVDNHRDASEVEIDLTEETVGNLLDNYLTGEPRRQSMCCHTDCCAVCLDTLNSTESIDTDAPSKLITLSGCNHTFHSKCLAFWFCKSSKMNCPVCREDHLGKVPRHQLPTKPRRQVMLNVISLTMENVRGHDRSGSIRLQG